MAYYQLNGETGAFSATAIDVLTFEGSQIKDITAFILPGLFPHFGLSADLSR